MTSKYTNKEVIERLEKANKADMPKVGGLPDSLAKIKDDYISDPNRSFNKEQLGFFSEGFNSGAEAMRTYMQAEMDKLEETLEQLQFCGIIDIEQIVRAALASHRAWKDKK